MKPNVKRKASKSKPNMTLILKRLLKLLDQDMPFEVAQYKAACDETLMMFNRRIEGARTNDPKENQ